MRKRDLPLPADFITDAVSVMDPPSRGGMGVELGSFTAAWPEVTVGTDWQGKPAISKADAARIHAHGLRVEAERQAEADDRARLAAEQARVNIAGRVERAEREAEEEVRRRDRLRTSHVNVPRTSPSWPPAGMTDIDGNPLSPAARDELARKKNPFLPDARTPTPGRSREERFAEQQEVARLIAEGHKP